MNNFTHTDSSGNAKMVDVTTKIENERIATAKATIILNAEVFELIKKNEIQKGDVLTVAKIAGIQASKKTSELIPLCHNIFISNVDINFILNSDDFTIDIISTAKTVASTGIEMESLTAVSIAALTIYDMCKAVDKSLIITDIKLISKSGGKSGDYIIDC